MTSRKLRNYLVTFAVTAIILTASFTLVYAREVKNRGRLAVYFFDVGQGDATFIRTPEGHQILIDGGPDKSVLSRLGEVMPFWDRDLDMVVMTHPHADHVTGLVRVLERYRVGVVISNPFEFESGAYSEWLSAISGDQYVRSMYAGDEFCLGEMRVCFKALWPQEKQIPFLPEERGLQSCTVLDAGECRPWADDNINNGSLVLLLTYRDFEVLLTGDAEQEVWARLSSSLQDIDVLKVPHQGSTNGITLAALEKLRPELSVIPVGKNKFGHPHQKILGWTSQYGQVWRTDKQGTLLVSY